MWGERPGCRRVDRHRPRRPATVPDDPPAAWSRVFDVDEIGIVRTTRAGNRHRSADTPWRSGVRVASVGPGRRDRTRTAREGVVAVRILAALVKAVLVVAVAGVGVLAAVFVIGMRTKNPAVQNRVRALIRDRANPRTLESAGTPGSPNAVVHHVGRSSGTEYRTPVTPIGAGPDDEFVVGLPYGSQADWVRNVLAAGTARVTYDGATWTVDRPEVIPATEVAGRMKPSERLVGQLFGVGECLRVHRAAVAA